MSDVRGMIRYLTKGGYTPTDTEGFDDTVYFFQTRGLSPSEIDETITILSDKAEKLDDRCGAARLLGIIKNKTAIPGLIEALGGLDKIVAQEAVRAIGDIKDESAIPALIGALGTEDLVMRCYAAEALEKIGDPRGIQSLVVLTAFESVHYISVRFLEKSLEECKTSEQLSGFERKFQLGFTELRKKHKSEFQKVAVWLADFQNKIAKKSDSLASDKGILLSDIPKPPKRGTIYRTLDSRLETMRPGDRPQASEVLKDFRTIKRSAMERVRNG